MRPRKRALLASATLVIAALVLSTAACDEDDPTRPITLADLIHLEIVSDPAKFTPDDGAAITVKATNISDQIVSLGYGSSSCILFALVEVEGETYAMYMERACLADYTNQLLAPGGERVESWTWYGDVWLRGERQTLPAGSFEIFPRVAKLTGDGIVIEIEE